MKDNFIAAVKAFVREITKAKRGMHWIERSGFAAAECRFLANNPNGYFEAAEKPVPRNFDLEKELKRIILWHFNPENHERIDYFKALSKRRRNESNPT